MKDNYVCNISIIVPAYNAEQYIRNCINSLVKQTYKNMEIILVDDGSLDSTGIICDDYQQLYESIIKVKHSSHCGVTHARLLGVMQAVGEYIAFVDADDWIESDYISSMLLSMDNADIIASGISREVQNEKESIIYEYNGILPGKYISETDKAKLYGEMLYCKAPFQFGVLPYICNKIFRKVFIQPILEKLDKRIFDGEDAAIVYPYLLLSQKIVLTDDCKYHYVNHGDSASLSDINTAYLNVSYLYQTLYMCFINSKYHKALMVQLDHYMRRMVWKKDPAAYLMINSFVFPYKQVELGSRVIFYGMGKAGTAFYQQIEQNQYCNIIAWADKNPKIFLDIPISIPRIMPEKIKDFQFDYIVIAIQNKCISYKVSKMLFSMGIDERKIIIPEL